MKRNLIFMRHGKVDLPYASHDEMPIEVLNDLATQKIDPQSNKKFFTKNIAHFKNLQKEFHFTSIFRSSSKRCASLENYIQNFSPWKVESDRVLEELSEIHFDLHVLFSSQKEITLEETNSKLFRSLVNGEKGVESYKKVLKRIDSALQKMPESGNILILTHGFLMRVIAARYELHDTVAGPSFDEILAIPRFGYFSGFVINGNNNIVKYFSPKLC